MAVDITEYRRERAERARKELEHAAGAPLVEQAEVSDEHVTGHDVLDKLVRAMQPLLVVLEKNSTDSALAGITAPAESVFREIQLQHVYILGKRDAFKEIVSLVQTVAAEEKKNAISIPV